MSLGVRHVSRRRKARISELPTRRSVLKNALDIIIYPAAFAAPIALIPQVWQLYVTRDASSLSLPTWTVLGFLNIVWIFYGYVHKEKPILITNLMFGFLNFTVAAGIVFYR